MINFKSDKINEAIIISIIISFMIFTMSNFFLYERYIDSDSYGIEVSQGDSFYDNSEKKYYSYLFINNNFEYSKPYLIYVEYHFQFEENLFYIYSDTVNAESNEKIIFNYDLEYLPSKIIYNFVGFDSKLTLVKNYE